MRINTLPNWAATALLSGPVFGSDEGEGAGAETGPDGKPAAVKDDPKPNAEENKAPQLTESQIQKLINDNESAKATISAYEQEKAEREAAAEEAERATRSKEENLTKDVERLTEENGKLKIVNERNLLELEIRRNSKFDWHDVNDVAALIDRTGIKIDAETGKVEGVENALKDLAKTKPHLLKTKQNQQDNSGNQSGAGFGSGPASGGVPSGNGDSSAKANRRKQLEGRFPVLQI